MKEQTKELLKAICKNFNRLDSIKLDGVDYRIYGFMNTPQFMLDKLENNDFEENESIMICFLVEYDNNEDLFLNEYRFSVADLDEIDKIELFKSEIIFKC